MQKIRDSLDPHDGVACFNRMYLQVTELVGQNLVEGFFEDAAFMERMDVVFADLYFQGFEAAQAGRTPDPSWKPLYDARSNRVVWPIQFAFAGMNAHINHDLPLAVIATCKEFGKTPDATPIHADYQRVNELLAKVESEVRQSFETKLLHLATNDAETLKHIVASWGMTAARDLAWNNTEMLWTQHTTPLLYDTQRPVRAGATNVAIRPAASLVLASAAPAAFHEVPAFVLLVAGVVAAHSSGRIRAGRGRSFATVEGAGRSSVAVLRTPAFSAVVATKLAGVQSRMSQNAERTCSDNRSGVPETRWWTWDADSSMPRSRNSGTSSVAVNIPRVAITSRSLQE
jgi:hypothetical protein